MMSGHDLRVVDAPQLPGAAEAGLHLVGDQRHPVARRRASRSALQPAVRGRDARRPRPGPVRRSWRRAGSCRCPDRRTACARAPPRSAPRRSRRRRRGSGSPAGRAAGSRPASGTPAGVRTATLPVAASAAAVIPWYAPVKATRPERPVAVRASLIAASTASAPLGPQKWIRASARELGRQQAEQGLGELVLDRRREVEHVQRGALVEHLADGLDHDRVVVAEGERCRRRRGSRGTCGRPRRTRSSPRRAPGPPAGAGRSCAPRTPGPAAWPAAARDRSSSSTLTLRPSPLAEDLRSHRKIVVRQALLRLDDRVKPLHYCE